MKPKVLVILNRIVIGGQAIDTIPLLYHLKQDFDILILYGCKEREEEDATFLFEKFGGLRLVPMKHFRRKLNVIRDGLSFFFILSSIIKFKPGAVHTHGLKSGLIGRTAAFVAGVKCIIHTFHGHHFHSYFGKFGSTCIIFIERLLASITTKIIAISNEQKNEFVTKYKIARPEKIQVVPLGIDERLFAQYDVTARHSFRAAYAVDVNTVAVGIIGRIVPIKNYALFVAVAAKVIAHKDNLNKVKFFVIGDGNEKKQVQAKLDELGISWCSRQNISASASVVFTSWIPGVAAALHGMDVVVLTSHNEGTPLSLVEAQFCGKPVVATNVGGVKDTLLDGETGFLAPPGNAEVLAAKLILLVNDKRLRTSMGNNAAGFAATQFSKTKETDSFRQLYQSCAK